MLSQILEKFGVWNYITIGGLRIDFADYVGLTSTRLEPIMASTNPAVAGHVWLCAPPFHIVDATVGYQEYSRGEAQYILHPILAEFVEDAGYEFEDLIDEDAVIEITMQLGKIPNLDDLYNLHPRLRERMSKYRPVTVNQKDVALTYIPIGVSAPDMPLEQAISLSLSGKGPQELFEEFKAEQTQD